MEKYLTTLDNIKIAINHFQNTPKRDEVVIISPGWFMIKEHEVFYNLSLCLAQKYDVIAMDFRGHGKSSGFFTFTAKELFDIKTVVDYAKKNYNKVYLMGFSLGGAVVLLHSAIRNDVDKVIAVSAPTDFNKIENHIWSPRAFIPAIKKMDLKCWVSIRPSIIPHKKLKPINYIDKITVPTLFLAGENDPTVCAWHAKALYEKATCKKKYVLFENANHAEDLFIDYKDKFISTCIDWLETA